MLPDMALRSVAVVLQDPVALFEFGVLTEVFGIDRTDDGVPAFDFRVCAERPGEPLRANGGTVVIPPLGLEAAADADLVARTLHGSDFPVPCNAFYYVRTLGHRRVLSLERERNPLQRDVALKRALGYPDDVLTRACGVLPNLERWVGRGIASARG